jgi:hypothetical protein
LGCALALVIKLFSLKKQNVRILPWLTATRARSHGIFASSLENWALE